MLVILGPSTLSTVTGVFKRVNEPANLLMVGIHGACWSLYWTDSKQAKHDVKETQKLLISFPAMKTSPVDFSRADSV